MMVRRAVNKSTNLTLNRLIDLQPTSTIGLFRNKFEDQQRWSRDSRTVVQRIGIVTLETFYRSLKVQPCKQVDRSSFPLLS